MESTAYKTLRTVYHACYDRFQFRGRLRGGSLLVSCLEVKNNVRFALLSEASIGSESTDAQTVSELASKGLIRETDEPGRFTITAQGIWEVESTEQVLDVAALIDYLDRKNFALFSKAHLTDKEKVVIFCLIAVRAFSENSCVDLHLDDATMEAWRGIIEKSHDLLLQLNVVPNLTRGELLRTKGTERPVSHLIRHTDALPRKTKGIFRAPGRQRYFLDLFDGVNIPLERLSFLFRLIFEGNLGVAGMETVLDFCRTTAYDDAIQVFDFSGGRAGSSEHLFAKPAYDDVIREALHRSLVQL